MSLDCGRFFVVLLLAGCGSVSKAPGDASPDGGAGSDGAAADGSVGSDDAASEGPAGSDGAAADGPAGSDGAASDGSVGTGTTAGCTYDIQRKLSLDDATSFGPTVRQLGTSFAIGTPWTFQLSWAPLGSQTEASWSPHDAASSATLSLDWGDGVVEYAGGHAPTGTRLACPSYVLIDTAVRLVSADGGFDESWHLDAKVSQFSQGQLSISSDLRALGLYAFTGTYAFQWLEPWPVEKAYLLVNVYASSAVAPTSLEGALQEVSQRETVDDAGVSSGGSGDGVIAKVAYWSATLP